MCFYVIKQQERLFKASTIYLSHFFYLVFLWPLSACMSAHSTFNSQPLTHSLVHLSLFTVFTALCSFYPCFCCTKCLVLVTHTHTDPQHVTQLQFRAAVCALTFLLAGLYITPPLNHLKMSNIVQYVNFRNTCKATIHCYTPRWVCVSSMLPCGSCCSLQQRNQSCCATRRVWGGLWSGQVQKAAATVIKTLRLSLTCLLTAQSKRNNVNCFHYNTVGTKRDLISYFTQYSDAKTFGTSTFYLVYTISALFCCPAY